MAIADFIAACQNAVSARDWYSSLALALTIPDICAACVTPGNVSSPRYIKWWATYVQPKYTGSAGNKFMTGGDAYALRCAYLHSGTTDLNGHKAGEVLNRIHFVAAPAGGGIIHKIKFGNVLQLDVGEFAKEVMQGADQWSQDVAEDAEVQARLAGLIYIHEMRDGPFDMGPIRMQAS